MSDIRNTISLEHQTSNNQNAQIIVVEMIPYLNIKK